MDRLWIFKYQFLVYSAETMIGEFFIKNGELLPALEGVISIDHLELFYGFGVYELVKVRHQKAHLLSDHAERLTNSAKIIGLEHEFTAEKIGEWAEKLLEANKIEAANLKMILLGGSSPAEAMLNMFLTAPRFVEKKEYRDGVKVITVKHERFLPQAKTLNMLPSYLAYREAQKSGAFDALFIDHENKVHEGTRTNFFAIQGTALITPPLEVVLGGITRQTVIECARQNGYVIEEKLLSVAEIKELDGAFITNTSGGIVPIKQIDEFAYPEVALEIQKLRKLYEDFKK